jgi:putative transposase
MRYPASGKFEIIRTVDASHLPAKRTLAMLGIPSSTFYRWYDLYLEGRFEALQDKSPKPNSVWNRVPDDKRELIIDFALENEDLTPRELAVKFTNTKRYFVSDSTV